MKNFGNSFIKTNIYQILFILTKYILTFHFIQSPPEGFI